MYFLFFFRNKFIFFFLSNFGNSPISLHSPQLLQAGTGLDLLPTANHEEIPSQYGALALSGNERG